MGYKSRTRNTGRDDYRRMSENDTSTLPTDDQEHGCITTRQTHRGFWWRYTHREGEPSETLDMAIRVAGEVAASEARKSRKTYVVASTPSPAAAVYVFAADHPDAVRIDINIMYELTPAGGLIRRRVTRQ
jgi:hypothetical protein